MNSYIEWYDSQDEHFTPDEHRIAKKVWLQSRLSFNGELQKENETLEAKVKGLEGFIQSYKDKTSWADGDMWDYFFTKPVTGKPEDLSYIREQVQALKIENASKDETIAKLGECVEFYADKENIDPYGVILAYRQISEDEWNPEPENGNKARETLRELEGGE